MSQTELDPRGRVGTGTCIARTATRLCWNAATGRTVTASNSAALIVDRVRGRVILICRESRMETQWTPTRRHTRNGARARCPSVAQLQEAVDSVLAHTWLLSAVQLRCRVLVDSLCLCALREQAHKNGKRTLIGEIL